MKIPLVWLQDYVDIKDKSPKEVASAFTQLGLMLDKPLDNTGVLDLEHRMDRSDWLSIVGCARDLSAYYNLPLSEPHIKLGKLSHKQLVKVTVQTSSVRRFKTRIIKGLTVKPSPKWLLLRLKQYGIEPINNIVDITNFCMVELGQTLHAQDLAQLKESKITLRQAKSGEFITTLLGTNVSLTSQVFVLASGGEATVIGGIVGGKATGVTNATKDIILDAGNYDQTVIRKNSRLLKIFNESVLRNDKFLDPRAIDLALDRATALILELAGGVAYENDDYYPQVATPKTQKLRYSRLALLSGSTISTASVKKTLKNLGYIIVEETGTELEVEVPYFRTDVEVEDDLVADILRIGDYNNLPSSPIATPVPHDITPPLITFEEKLRDALNGQGGHEHITNSLVKSSGAPDEVILSNALSADQNALRTSLIPSLNLVIANYAKHKITDCLLYEIGKVFTKPDKELRQLSVVTTGDIRIVLATLFSTLGINKHFVNSKLEIIVDSVVIGHLENARSLTLCTDLLMKCVRSYQGVISEFEHLTVLDLSLKIPKGVVFADITSHLYKENKSIKTIESPEQYGDSILLRLTFDKQLQDVDSVRASLTNALKEMGVVSRSG